MRLQETAINNWMRHVEKLPLAEKYSAVMEELADSPLPLNESWMDDFVELLVEVKGKLVANKEYGRVVELAAMLRKGQPELYQQEFPYFEEIPIRYYLFNEQWGELDVSLEAFRKNPEVSIDLLIPIIHCLQFSLKSELAGEIAAEVYPIIKNSPHLMGGAEIEFAETVFYNLFEDAYKTLKSGETVDWEPLLAQLDAVGYEKKFRDRHFQVIKETLAEAASGKRGLQAEWKADFTKNKAVLLQRLLWHFLAVMLEQKGIPFSASRHFWFATVEIAYEKGGSSKPRAGSKGGFFSFSRKDILNYVDNLVDVFLVGEVEKAIGAVWGMPYVFDFLLDAGLVDKGEYESVLKNIQSVKEEFLGSGMELWQYEFVHLWKRPDSIPETEFHKEKAKFRKTFEREARQRPEEAKADFGMKKDVQLSFEELWLDPEELLEEDDGEGVNVNEGGFPLQDAAFPMAIVKDFDKFLDFIEKQPVMLTKTKEYISRKYLPKLNGLLSVRREDASPQTEQEYYPYIHFLYHVAVAGGLLEKFRVNSAQLQLIATDRLALYQSLTDAEKYFFLLETFWVDLDWSELSEKRHNPIAESLQEIMLVIMEENQSAVLSTDSYGKGKSKLSEIQTFGWHYFFLYFEWLGFWVCEPDSERMDNYGRKNWYFAKSITPTEFGLKVIPILFIERNLFSWNIPLRRENGEVNPIPGSMPADRPFLLLPDEQWEEIELLLFQDRSAEPFIQPFQPLVPDGVLQKGLPRDVRKFREGMYTFKISLSKHASETIILSAFQTMAELHHAIQLAFGFHDDHLYSFFMNGIPWSHNCIASPYEDDGHPNAEKVKIGEVGLRESQRFLYIYDYGEEWSIWIEVLSIQP